MGWQHRHGMHAWRRHRCQRVCAEVWRTGDISCRQLPRWRGSTVELICDKCRRPLCLLWFALRVRHGTQLHLCRYHRRPVLYASTFERNGSGSVRQWYWHLCLCSYQRAINCAVWLEGVPQNRRAHLFCVRCVRCSDVCTCCLKRSFSGLVCADWGNIWWHNDRSKRARCQH